MNENAAIAWSIILTGAFVWALLAVLTVGGCAPSPHDARASLFAAELLACVHDAGSRAESQACREGVERRWRRPHE